MLRWPELAADPQRVHPVHYGNVAAQLPQLFIDDLDVIDDQAVALRLVHVDKLYDQEVRLRVASRVPLADIFAASYRHGGYEKSIAAA
jgi:cell division protein ZapE